ncbi:protein NLP6-like [Henckelia pumila]|uniref:protein NLP6-like n=1 Tax=Henckelia pumila TaxID=405737 RepID=UPI003C6DF1A6
MGEESGRFDGEEYSAVAFIEYFQDHNLCLLPKQSQPLDEPRRYGWICCGSEGDTSYVHGSHERSKIQLLVHEITKWRWKDIYLVQFWAPIMVAGRPCLSTSDQPFAVDSLWKGLCRHRKHCMEHDQSLVDGGGKEEDIGPLRRVFKKGYPESTPDLRLYSSKKYSLQDHAALCGLRRYMAFPVFDPLQDQCIGVLKVLSPCRGFMAYADFRTIELALEAANLRPTHINFSPCLLSGSLLNLNISEAQRLELSEIKEMLQLLIQLPQLNLAQIWIPCSQCAKSSIHTGCMDQATFITNEKKNDWDLSQFLAACQLHRVQAGNGVAGRVLSSTRKLCFCQNLCDFSITEFPLAHYAREAKLTTSFAICLQSIHSETNIYVIEFFINASNGSKGGYPWSFIHFLLPVLEMKLGSFKVASGQQLGGELIVEVLEIYKENDITLVELDQPKLYPFKFEFTQHGHDMEQQLLETRVNSLSTRNVGKLEQKYSIVAQDSEKGAMPKKANRKRNAISFSISYDVLKQHFGKRLGDVAEGLGVGKSTLKRACRDCGIHRWPSNDKNKKSPFLFEATNTTHCVPSNGSFPSSPIRPNVENNGNFTRIQPETKALIMKAKFEDDVIKFQSHMSSRMEEPEEQVARKLKIEIGSFKLKYLDEDGQWILLTCDEDLQLGLMTLASEGKTPIQLQVQLMCN